MKQLWNKYNRLWEQLATHRPLAAFGAILSIGLLSFVVGCVVAIIAGHHDVFEFERLIWLAAGLLIGAVVRIREAKRGSMKQSMRTRQQGER